MPAYLTSQVQEQRETAFEKGRRPQDERRALSVGQAAGFAPGARNRQPFTIIWCEPAGTLPESSLSIAVDR